MNISGLAILCGLVSTKIHGSVITENYLSGQSFTPISGWIILLLTIPVACAIVTTSILCGLRGRKVFKASLQDYQKLTEDLKKEGGYSAEHLAVLKNFTGSSLQPALTGLLDDSEVRFKGEWLAEPEAYLQPTSALPTEDLHWLSLNLAVRPAILGFISSTVAFFVAALFYLTDLFHKLVPLPLGVGLAASAILLILQLDRKRQLEAAAASACQAIRLRLPVYDNRYGLALLLDEFHEYDRQMADRIAAFDRTVSHLAEAQFVTAMQNALTDTLKETVEPTMTKAQTTLADLAGRIRTEQTTGMQQLAESFTLKLKGLLEDKWSPLYEEAGRLTAGLTAGAEQLTKLASAQQDTLAGQNALNEEMNQRAKAFEDRHRLWLEDLTQLNTTINGLSDRLQEEISEKQNRESALNDVLARFTEDLNCFTAELNRSGEALVAERKAFSDLVDRTHQAGAETVADYRLLSTQITAATMDMQNTNQQLADIFRQTEHDLDKSVQVFSDGMGAMVKDSLTELEAALGKISLHLATGAAAVESSVKDLEQATRLKEQR